MGPMSARTHHVRKEHREPSHIRGNSELHRDLERVQLQRQTSSLSDNDGPHHSSVKNGPTPYLMAALRNLYKVISRQLDSALALSCYSQNQWLPELLTAEVLTLKCCICILATRL